MISSFIKYGDSIESLQQKYANETLVIKFGGSVAGNVASVQSIAQQIGFLQTVIGAKVILVHGGKEQINTALDTNGLVSEWHTDTQERLTTPAMMPVIDDALRNLNNKLAFQMECASPAVTFYGAAGYEQDIILADATRDLTGKVININTGFFADLASHITPIFYSVAQDAKGQKLNINADDMAVSIASALNAKCLLLLSDCSGVLDDNNQIISTLRENHANSLMKNGTVINGMIPKVKGAFEAAKALPQGRVIVLNGNVQDIILAAITDSQGAGTVIQPNVFVA